MRYERHVFVCENRRPDGHPRGCCASKGGAEVKEALKAELKARGLQARVRANSAGCLDACEQGAAMVVYPEGVWYGGVTPDDVAGDRRAPPGGRRAGGAAGHPGVPRQGRGLAIS